MLQRTLAAWVYTSLSPASTAKGPSEDRETTPIRPHRRGGFLVARKPPFSASDGTDVRPFFLRDTHAHDCTQFGSWRRGSTGVRSEPHPHRVRAFPNVHRLLRLILTLPVTTCECERSVSVLGRLKTYTFVQLWYNLDLLVLHCIL